MERPTTLGLLFLTLFQWTNAQGVAPFSSLLNVSYGSDAEQVMDVYLPGGRDASVSKVIVLIHGGAWKGGSRERLLEEAIWLSLAFPRYAIANLDYRLGTLESPAFSKQLQDIALALHFLKSKEAAYKIQPSFALIGVSSGAHMSLLYAYAYDALNEVKVIVNIVGPTDLTASDLTQLPTFTEGMPYLVGANPTTQIYTTASPVTHVKPHSPSTLSFYGGMDTLVPASQGRLLEETLDAVGVYNKLHVYATEPHTFTQPDNKRHMRKKINVFLKNYF